MDLEHKTEEEARRIAAEHSDVVLPGLVINAAAIGNIACRINDAPVIFIEVLCVGTAAGHNVETGHTDPVRAQLSVFLHDRTVVEHLIMALTSSLAHLPPHKLQS